jgi:hypothetical protein
VENSSLTTASQTPFRVKKLDGDIRTSVRHPMWSQILSMGRNQQDVFIKWKQAGKKS